MKVDSQRLKDQAANMRVMEHRLQDVRADVLRVIGRLREESFADSFHEPLQRLASSIGNECRDLTVLRSTLTQIADVYEDRERRIADEAERASVHHIHRPIGVSPIRVGDPNRRWMPPFVW